MKDCFWSIAKHVSMCLIVRPHRPFICRFICRALYSGCVLTTEETSWIASFVRYRCRVCHDDAIYLRKTAKATLSVIHEELNVLTLLSSDRCSALGSCDLSEVDPLATADDVSRNIVRCIAVSKDCIVMMTTEFTATQCAVTPVSHCMI